ncbi:hypothetical protein QYH69_18015 [Paraburkholderia sp. SARCC-3016]|uniref:hypothetical protein n=1 Tax=Paraburkholderia sp. SARCC-3016 TaxID=3058611 RepID=UPI002806E53F|nr:hypothetical protein [Paraburkholderia sp. SARCC-3016]MDQ7979149.1 hypothetical protein [Paraburkholderia sp. SARCC-3016]
MKFTILAFVISVLAGCSDKSAQIEAQHAAAAKQLRDGSNIVSSPPKNWTWDGASSQPQKKDQ